MSVDENIIQQQGAGPCFEKQIAVIGFSCATMGNAGKAQPGLHPHGRAPSFPLAPGPGAAGRAQEVPEPGGDTPLSSLSWAK